MACAMLDVALELGPETDPVSEPKAAIDVGSVAVAALVPLLVS